MNQAHPQMRGSVHKYGGLAVTEGSRPTERLLSETPTQPLSSMRGVSDTTSFDPRFVKVPLAELSRKPETLSHVQAASMTLPWLCAWITIETLAKVKKGDNVIIIGASGPLLRHAKGYSFLSTHLQALVVALAPRQRNFVTTEAPAYLAHIPRSRTQLHHHT